MKTNASTTPLRLLLIGGHGHHYLHRVVERGDGVAAMLFDEFDPEAAKRYAKRAGIDTIFTSWDDAMKWRPDAASVGVAYAKNGPVATDVLDRGFRVVTDKPAAVDRATLDRLKRACSREGAVLLTEFDMRCRPEFRAARAAIANGDIGTPLLATAQKSYKLGTRPAFYGDASLAAGLLLWVASHGIDMIQHTTGLPLTPTSALPGPPASPRYSAMEACVTASFRLGREGVAVAHADYLRPAAAEGHGDDRLRVAGTNGVVEVADGRCRLTTTDAATKDITPSQQDRPDVADELLASLLSPAETQMFSTHDSLRIAEVLVKAAELANTANDERRS